MILDEHDQGISFSNAFIHFPDLLSEANTERIDRALHKWDSIKDDFNSIEDALSCQMLSDDEILGYALWKAAIVYGEYYDFKSDIGKNVFSSILEKLTRYYRALSAGA